MPGNEWRPGESNDVAESGLEQGLKAFENAKTPEERLAATEMLSGKLEQLELAAGKAEGDLRSTYGASLQVKDLTAISDRYLTEQAKLAVAMKYGELRPQDGALEARGLGLRCKKSDVEEAVRRLAEKVNFLAEEGLVSGSISSFIAVLMADNAIDDLSGHKRYYGGGVMVVFYPVVAKEKLARFRDLTKGFSFKPTEPNPEVTPMLD